MATNLRAKIPASDKLYIHDVNPDVTQKFASENKNVDIASNVRDIAINSVCFCPLLSALTLHDDPLFYL